MSTSSPSESHSSNNICNTSSISEYDRSFISECEAHNCNEKTIHYVDYNVQSDSYSTDNNNQLLDNEQMIHYSNYDIESDSDESNESEILNNTVSSLTLCSNSDMTVDSAVLNFLNLYIANNKTKTCLKADLHFITSALPKPNRMPKTVFKLLEYVKQQAPPLKVITHYCCKVCQFYYGTSKEVLCNACNSDAGYILFFEIDILNYIQHLFQYKNLADVLDKTF